MRTTIAAVLCLAASFACQRTTPRVRMGTTTSVENSGLLAAILPAFEREAHLAVEVLPVGSGQTMNLLKRGEVDVGLTHDAAAEAAALGAGIITGYQKIMFNDFVIVGPADDPAAIKGVSNAVDAFSRIAASTSPFASRGDGSGTYSREQELWASANRRPQPKQVLDTGQGMGGTLRVASERHAYTLTDRATFEQFRTSLQLSSLYEGGAELLNTYAIFVRAGLHGDESRNAEALVRWFADGVGRQHIADFAAHGQHVFNVWPTRTPRDNPHDRPATESTHAR